MPQFLSFNFITLYTILVTLLALTLPISSRIYTSRKAYDLQQKTIQVKMENTPQYRQSFQGQLNLVTKTIRKVATEVLEEVSKEMYEKYQWFVNYLSQIQPNFMKQIWSASYNAVEYLGLTNDFDFETLEIPVEREDGPTLVYNSNMLHPGMVIVIQESLIKDAVAMMLPEILDIVFKKPLDLMIDLKYAYLDRIYLDFKQLNTNDVKIRLDDEHNSIEIKLPQVPLSCWIDIILNIPGMNPIPGRIQGSFNIEKPILHLRFEDDLRNPFFTPRIKLLLDDGFKLKANDLNIKTIFPGMPNFFIDGIIWLFSGFIANKVQQYLVDEFIAGGSVMLFYILEEHYPKNISLGLGGAYINMMFLKRPIVEMGEIRFFLAGDIFTLEDHPNLESPDFYLPKGNPTRPIVLNDIYDPALNFQLSISLLNIKKILNIVFENLQIPLDNPFLKAFSINKIVFGTKRGYSLSITQKQFRIKNLMIKIRSNGDNTVFWVKVSIYFRIQYIDIMRGNFKLEIFYLDFTFHEIIQNLLLIDFLLLDVYNSVFNALYHSLHQKDINIPSLIVPLKPGMVVSPIYFNIHSDMINIFFGFKWFNSPNVTNFFFQLNEDEREMFEANVDRLNTEMEDSDYEDSGPIDMSYMLI